MHVSLSLQARLAIIFAITTTLLILIFSIVYGQRSINQMENEIGNSLSDTAYMMENNLNQYMWSRYSETILLSGLPTIRQPDSTEEIEDLLDQLQSTIPSFSWIGFTDQNGTVLAATDSILKGADISARPVYKEALEKPFIGDVHEAVLLADLLPNPTGEAMKFVDISTPIYDYDDQFIGVLATHLSWEWVKEVESAMLDAVKNRDSIEFFIVSKIDNAIILGPDEMIGQTLQLESIDLAQTSQHGWVTETWPDGGDYVTGYMLEDGYNEYPGMEWTILVRQPIEVAFTPIKKLMVFFIIAGIMFVLLFAVLGWFLAGKIASPLKNLATAADRLRFGEHVQIPHYKGISELETLSASLRKLIANLTKTESALEEMEEVAHKDELTGLANRYALELFLHKYTQKYDRAIVFYIDLDGFKAVNDTLGHLAGDQLLVQVSARLKESVGEEEMIARVGGDEFIVVLHYPIEEMAAKGKRMGETMLSAISEPYWLNGQSASVSCSIGAAFWTESSAVSIEETIKRADDSLYQVKKQGKNHVHFYEA
ncbi:sensor domain-containing diguanylate cyclase [Jeotgalibacillus terrae]|uniref:Diguanylate cyclase domain-containing protein n=1 Tax=Jeotgalibacillus terrae TaxID=587735 RepID=A0ABW5ZGQ6_9BACL|nr:sensor domain-containing diguanylate cyclase [Jeotgalibacillus terrae]MBM7578541.1 diguanylate cyclase (GGDEF)-like protein [Jeotgalibacillus terrae]